jgi:hypothetical protein
MDSSDSEDHPGEDEWTKYNYVMEGYTLMEVVRYHCTHQGTRGKSKSPDLNPCYTISEDPSYRQDNTPSHFHSRQEKNFQLLSW